MEDLAPQQTIGPLVSMYSVFYANFRLFPLVLHCDRITKLGIDLSQREKFDKSGSIVDPEDQVRSKILQEKPLQIKQGYRAVFMVENGV